VLATDPYFFLYAFEWVGHSKMQQELVCAFCFVALNGSGKFTFISSHEA
jgi:hypothetical protein